LRGDIAKEILRLKRQPGGDILVFGSADLVNSLMKHDLIDEYRLMVFPVVLGSGKRLFRDESDTLHLQLVGTRAFSSGVVVLTYEPASEGPSSEYTERFAYTEEQVRSMQAAQNADRVLASVLFTDIVDSTGRAATLGDREWRKVLDRHDRIARAEVDRFRGHVVKATGGRDPGHLRCAHSSASMCVWSHRDPRGGRTHDPRCHPHGDRAPRC
jgi:hypothetical protein